MMFYHDKFLKNSFYKKAGILAIILSMMVMLFNGNVENISNSDLSLANLASINSVNAETDYPCYDFYIPGGSWLIINCNGCNQVKASAWSYPSTCSGI